MVSSTQSLASGSRSPPSRRGTDFSPLKKFGGIALRDRNLPKDQNSGHPWVGPVPDVAHAFTVPIDVSHEAQCSSANCLRTLPRAAVCEVLRRVARSAVSQRNDMGIMMNCARLQRGVT